MLSKGHSSVMRAPSARARVSLSRRPLVKVRASFSSVAPLGSRILVRIEKSQPQSAGGILLPSSSQKKQNNGVVVSISEDVASVTKGDKVLYSEYAGTEVDFQDEEHIILKSDDVIGVMPSDDVSKLKPCGPRILIECTDAEESTTGGVLLTQSVKERPLTGSVVAIGQGAEDESGKVQPLSVKVGATVMYSKYSGMELEGKDGKQFIVVGDSDLLAELS
ncbi:chaperonin GroES [Pycnococcus provasolii]